MLTCAAGAGLSLTGHPGSAAGFALIEQSVSAMGTAYAGGAAEAADATTVFFNPAGMSRLPGAQVITGIQVIRPKAKFHDEGSTSTPGAILGDPGILGDSNGGDAGQTRIVPTFYYSQPLNETWSAGIGVNAPFGLATKYHSDWVGRYYGVKSEVRTVNINPAIAYRLNDRLSIGAGVSYQYIDAKLTNRIDFGSIGLFTAAAIGMPELAAGLLPGQNDGRVKLTGDDWSWGYNFGFLLDITEDTRVGMQYRSKVSQSLKGDASFRVPQEATFLQATGNFQNTNVEADVDLPASASASVFHQLSEAWALMADVTWTDWSTLQELRFRFESTHPDGVESLKWEDSYRFAVGVAYRPDSRWTWRAGAAYDQTPIPNEQYRSVRVPGEDRTWVTVGLGYRYSENLSFDFGYAHLFVKDPKIDKTSAAPGEEDFFRGDLKGEYDASVDIIGGQLSWTFH
jgi:long-chain fatty acid transport protein